MVSKMVNSIKGWFTQAQVWTIENQELTVQITNTFIVLLIFITIVITGY